MNIISSNGLIEPIAPESKINSTYDENFRNS